MQDLTMKQHQVRFTEWNNWCCCSIEPKTLALAQDKVCGAKQNLTNGSMWKIRGISALVV